MPNSYSYKLKNGKSLTFKGDTPPSDEQVETAAKENSVELVPIESNTNVTPALKSQSQSGNDRASTDVSPKH
jgi:TusA-related sulfurtransferase